MRLMCQQGSAAPAPGAEVRMCYGDKGSEELLVLYGFVAERCAHDYVMVQVGRRAAGRVARGVLGGIVVRGVGCVVRGVWCAGRLAAGTAKGAAVALAASCHCMLEVQECPGGRQGASGGGVRCPRQLAHTYGRPAR